MYKKDILQPTTLFRRLVACGWEILHISHWECELFESCYFFDDFHFSYKHLWHDIIFDEFHLRHDDNDGTMRKFAVILTNIRSLFKGR